MTLNPKYTSFRESIGTICPPFLRNTWGERYMYTAAIHLDAMADWLIEGVKARMPGAGTPEALPAIGSDRVVVRGFAQTDESYIAQLQSAFDDWGIAGNPVGVIGQLVGYVSPATPKFRYVVTGIDRNTSNVVTQWITVEAGTVTLHRADPANWDWDGETTTDLSRFWIIIYPGVTVLDDRKVWGDGHTYGDGTAWGYNGSPNIATDLRRITKIRKAAGSLCVFIIVAADNADFDPTGAPGFPLPDGDWDQASNRLQTALYIAGN